ncbi:MAG: PKD domain-containing protein [Paludibacter sp.]|nr:PKD domain-containing protein [Paludibacter sp.]
MKQTLSRFLVLALVFFLIVSCSTPIEPDFSFSPEAPKAGQKITFTNLTESGEVWNWTFGDGGSSVAKSPTYTYRKPGVYDITLRADSNDNYIVTKQITIYDTIPSILLSAETVNYYEDITFSVLAYNPYGYEATYEWEFSENAVSELIIDGKSDQASLQVFFNKHSVTETVKLNIQLGDSSYSVETSFTVQNIPSRSLVVAGADGKVYRQRIFLRGVEEYTTTSYTTGKNPFTIQAINNQLYMFNLGSKVGDSMTLEALPGDGSIVSVNMSDNSTIEWVHNRTSGAANGFASGYVDNTYLYWTDLSRLVYRHPLSGGPIGALEWKGSVDAQTSLPYYLVKPDRLGYFGNGLDDVGMNTGFYEYDFVYFWSKGTGGKGIYRFTNQDILTSNLNGKGTAPASGAILTDFSIRSFAIDHLNQKIYFAVTAPADKIGFWVANLSGNNPVRIDDAPMDSPGLFITDIAIDHYSNKVYWAYRAPVGLTESDFEQHPTYRTGVKMVRLAKNYSVDTAVEYFIPGIAAFGISIDDVKKY